MHCWWRCNVAANKVWAGLSNAGCKTSRPSVNWRLSDAWEPVELGERRLQSTAAVHFFTVFLAHSGGAMSLQIRQKLSSLGPIFRFRRPKSDELLVGDRKPLLHVARCFQLVHDGHGHVFHRDAAGLVTVHQRGLGAQAVLAGAFAGLQQDGG